MMTNSKILEIMDQIGGGDFKNIESKDILVAIYYEISEIKNDIHNNKKFLEDQLLAHQESMDKKLEDIAAEVNLNTQAREDRDANWKLTKHVFYVLVGIGTILAGLAILM